MTWSQDSVRFEYEITPDEFAATQALFQKASRTGDSWITWLIAGVLFTWVAWNERVAHSKPALLLAVVGAYSLYTVITLLFPSMRFRSAYALIRLAGMRFKAEADENSFRVAGDSYSWDVRWSGVLFKGENESVFMLCSQGTIFAFGKKYLSEQQQNELRRLSGISGRSCEIAST